MALTMDIYTEHFGLRERPFTLVPNPEFLYWSPAHRKAAAILEYGILTRAPITLITGEVGSGKTTLLRNLLRSVEDEVGEVKVGLISNPIGGRDELFRWVLMALDDAVPEDLGYVDLHRRLETYLIEQYAAGRRVVLIFDEAQNLDHASLELIRMLTNINSDDDELLQLVLVGQPELRDMVMRPELKQFAQRVTASFFLPKLGEGSVADYIDHRLRVAGAEDDVFTAESIDLIHAATGGTPRLINQLCDFAMLYAFEEGSHLVTRQTVQCVIDDGLFFAAGQSRALQTDTQEPVAGSERERI